MIILQTQKGLFSPVPTSTHSASSDIVRDYKRHWTPVHLDFLAENVDDIVKKVIHSGGLHEGGESGDWGLIAYCSDPFGNGFCVINEKSIAT